MNIQARIIFLFAVFLFISRANGAGYSDKTVDKALKLTAKLWVEETIIAEPLVSDPAGDYYSPEDSLFTLLNEDTEFLGYLVVSTAKGRFEWFDFMIVYNAEYALVNIRILVYRSEHGSEISSRNWLKQFYGPIPDNGREYGSQVDALSGATFSARSLTQEINRLNGLINKLRTE